MKLYLTVNIDYSITYIEFSNINFYIVWRVPLNQCWLCSFQGYVTDLYIRQLQEPIRTHSQKQICVTKPQWVKESMTGKNIIITMQKVKLRRFGKTKLQSSVGAKKLSCCTTHCCMVCHMVTFYHNNSYLSAENLTTWNSLHKGFKTAYLKSCKIRCHNLNSKDTIITNLHTPWQLSYHDYAKQWPDQIIIFQVRTTWTFTRFGLWARKSLWNKSMLYYVCQLLELS